MHPDRPRRRPCRRARTRARARDATRILGAAVTLVLLLTGCSLEPDPPAGRVRASATVSPGGPAPSPGEPSSSAGPSASPRPAPAPDPRYGAPEVRECHQLTAEEARAPVSASLPVRCARQHTGVVARVALVRDAVTTGTTLARRRAVAQRLCLPAFRRVVGGSPADRATSILTWTMFTPARDELARGARWVRCEVIARSGSELIPLPDGRPLLGDGVPEQLRVCQTARGTDVSCARPHVFRVEAVFRAAGGAYPTAARFTATARERCGALTGGRGQYWQPPGRAGWAAGDRFVRCLSKSG